MLLGTKIESIERLTDQGRKDDMIINKERILNPKMKISR
jgi:hypothetical protein